MPHQQVKSYTVKNDRKGSVQTTTTAGTNRTTRKQSANVKKQIEAPFDVTSESKKAPVRRVTTETGAGTTQTATEDIGFVIKFSIRVRGGLGAGLDEKSCC